MRGCELRKEDFPVWSLAFGTLLGHQAGAPLVPALRLHLLQQTAEQDLLTEAKKNCPSFIPRAYTPQGCEFP
jgi:hypothetical protein